jgi:putative ABC transport system permease protein
MIVATRFPDVDIGGMYLVRAEAGQSGRVLESAKKTLRDLNPTHVQPMAKTFAEFKRERVAKTSALAYMLGFLVIGLVGIALFGIASLTSLWVRQRRTSIGIRRALGATSGQILGYFLVENAVLMAVSGLLGVGLAIAINLMAAAYLSLPSISLPMCLMSFAGMVGLGQAAALGPALRAARMPPASTIRNL